jgi:hypothetical protein
MKSDLYRLSYRLHMYMYIILCSPFDNGFIFSFLILSFPAFVSHSSHLILLFLPFSLLVMSSLSSSYWLHDSLPSLDSSLSLSSLSDLTVEQFLKKQLEHQINQLRRNTDEAVEQMRKQSKRMQCKLIDQIISAQEERN